MTEVWHIRKREGDPAYNVTYGDPQWEDNRHYLSEYEFVEGHLVLSWSDPPEPMDLNREEASFLAMRILSLCVAEVCIYQDNPESLPEGSKFTVEVPDG